jgi:DNA-binding XRE family transcriptional regulator
VDWREWNLAVSIDSAFSQAALGRSPRVRPESEKVVPYRTTAEVVELIAARRKALRMSQVAAAKLAGVTNVYWCYVERGKSPPPELETLTKMAAAVGLKVSGPVKVLVSE